MQPGTRNNVPAGWLWLCHLSWHRCKIWSVYVGFSCKCHLAVSLRELWSCRMRLFYGVFNYCKRFLTVMTKNTDAAGWSGVRFSKTKCFLCGVLEIAAIFPDVLSEWAFVQSKLFVFEEEGCVQLRGMDFHIQHQVTHKVLLIIVYF